MAQGKRRIIGQILKEMKCVTESQIQEALAIQKQRGGVIGEILAELGYVSEADIRRALCKQAGMQEVDLDKVDIPPELIGRVTADIAATYKVVPVSEQKGVLYLAMADPLDVKTLDALRFMLGRVEGVLADTEAVERAVERYYSGQGESAEDIMRDLDDSALADFEQISVETIDEDTITKMADSAPVKKLLSLVLLNAIRDKASDIHFEPFEEEFRIRYRVDGALYEMQPPPKPLGMALTSRIKVLADLNIAERRVPQDGRIELNVAGSQVDLRISVLPTMFGESVVMRVLDRTAVSLDLNRLGLRDDDLAVFRQLISKPNGIILVTGPTGSGKTTTLYSALNEINSVEDKIITTEDPVEYDLNGIMQVQVHPEYDVTFASCLRSILRQDPDIILIGEIRDHETAEIAVHASLTGHLVFSTLHTNDAPTSITRLLEIGVEPYLLTATVEGIVAQRLVRRICKQCKHEFAPSADILKEIGLTLEEVQDRKFAFGVGCDACSSVGYKGRMAIIEQLILDDDLRDLIMDRASAVKIRDAARQKGMRTLRQSGILGIYDQMTTIEEVMKETVMEDMDIG
ncbi:MAG: Flp pilus assembly complex ATPase component [Planctomycetes bacterium]|nr:Flp pilus assembly complex ATPase component [Planctomycetota bacterium]